MLGESEKFKVLSVGNKALVEDAYDYGALFNGPVKEIVVSVVRETVKNGGLSFGYDTRDRQPVLRFVDPDGYCEKSVPLLSYLKEMDEFYRSQIDPDIDGDPVGHRFIRFMIEGVRFFLKEERAGRNPQ